MIKNTKIKWIFFVLSVILVLSIVIGGCYSKKKLDTPNLTSYIFNANIEQVKSAIINGFNDYQMGLSLYLKGDLDFYNNSIYNVPQNKNDAMLITLPNIDSKIYFRLGKSLPYSVEFHLHLDSISKSRTKVEVFTLNPEICMWGFVLNWGHGYSHMKKVPPSTIEEYEILLTIGKYLGETNMPPCNYPKK